MATKLDVLENLKKELEDIGYTVLSNEKIEGESGVVHSLDLYYVKQQGHRTIKRGLLAYTPENKADLGTFIMGASIIAVDLNFPVDVLVDGFDDTERSNIHYSQESLLGYAKILSE